MDGDLVEEEDDSINLNNKDHVRGRKRIRNPDNWNRCKIKRACNTGQSYVNSKGKIQQAKKIKKDSGLNCRFKCHSVFTDEDREYFP